MGSLKPPLLAVEYNRVSTRLQDELLSGDTQSAHILRASAEKGFKIQKRFSETGSGTSAKKRPTFLALIDYALDPANRIKAIWFYDPSRYSRDIADFYYYIGKLTKAGIEVHSVTIGQYLPGDETSEIVWGFNVLFNSMMPRQSARRTRDTQHEATKQGYHLSNIAPFGYRKRKIIAGGKKHSKLERDPEQWEDALNMWKMGLDKDTPTKVAQYNNSMGIRNSRGKEWTDEEVRLFYRKADYKGDTTRGIKQTSELIPNGVPIARCENAHEAMVTPAQWATVLGYIDERRTAQAGPRSISSPNPLSGIIKCGLCGETMHAQMRHDRVRYVICAKKKRQGKKACPSENVRFEDTLKTVISEVIEKILTKETLDRQIAAVAKENSLFLSEQQNTCKQLQQAQSRARGQIKILADAVEDSGGSSELYKRLNKRESELEHLKAEIKELEEIMGDHLIFLNDPDLIVRNALDLRTYLESDDQHTVGLFLKSFIEKVVVHSKTDGTIYWSIPLPSDGPSPSTTQEIHFPDRRGNKSYPLETLMGTRR